MQLLHTDNWHIRDFDDWYQELNTFSMQYRNAGTIEIEIWSLFHQIINLDEIQK